MHLEEFHRRQKLVDLAQSVMPLATRVSVSNVEVRDAPTDKPGRASFTVTPTADGRWQAWEWYSETGGLHVVEAVTATTREAAIDWAWWGATKSFRGHYVAPAADQWDLSLRDAWRRLLASGFRRKSPESDAVARLSWVDDSKSALRLGLAGLYFALTDPWVATRLARNPSTPALALVKLATHPHPAVLWQLAGNPSTPPRVLRQLRDTADIGVRWYLATRPETTTADIVTWSHDDPALWSAVVARPDLSLAQVERLDRDSSGQFRVALTTHSATSPELLSLFALECDQELGIALLECGRLSPGDAEVVLERAKEWFYYGLSIKLAGKTLVLPPETVRSVVSSEAVSLRLLAASAASPSSTEFTTLAADPHEDVRTVIGQRPGAPAAVLSGLATDPEWSVREAVAKNPGADATVLAGLAYDESPRVRKAAIDNPHIDRAVLEVMVDDPDGQVRRDAEGALTRRRRPAR